MTVVQSIALFLLAGMSEIGGGYFVWQWWRNGAHWGIGIIGAAVLIPYGIIPTYQEANFGGPLLKVCSLGTLTIHLDDQQAPLAYPVLKSVGPMTSRLASGSQS